MIEITRPTGVLVDLLLGDDIGIQLIDQPADFAQICP